MGGACDTLFGEMATITCVGCGRENADTQRFCGNCGESLERTCPHCGARNSLSFKFCGTCGNSLDEQLGPARAEERRWATVLFADLSGFTSLSERIDHEDARALIDRCMVKLGKIVEDYGGWVNRVIGDAILAVFGAPVAHEDDAERAVRAALEMRQCAVDNADEFENLTLRVGINTGETMFAPVGPEGARETTVTGDVVNTASRLQSAAPHGGVMVGEETYKGTTRTIRYEEIEPIRAKGKEVPVRAWLAVGAESLPAERPISAAPIVGRDREIGMMRQIWEGVEAERRPYLVTVLGPAGIGKTRLGREFASSLPGTQLFRGRSLPYGESTGYGAFAQQIKAAAEIFDSDPAPIAAQKLRHFVEGLFPAEEAGDVAEVIAIALGLSDVAAADRPVIFFAARRLVEAMGLRQPTVLLFEDIHWADANLLDLVESLASRTRETPVLFLVLARPELLEMRPNWGGGLVSHSALHLEPLKPEDARDLALKLLEGADATIAAELGERAEGNPLFIEELAASLAERAGQSVTGLPSHVKGIIAARLDSLPAPARTALLDASVAGKIFWRGAMERMGGGARINEALDMLEARDFIRREPLSRMQGDVEFTFKHMMILEVAYATLPKAARRQRHAAVAQYLEEASGDRIGDAASLLAHHWREAGDGERAIDYLVMAADRAHRGWAKKEAIGLLDEAIALLPPEDERRRLELRLKKGEIHAHAADYSSVVQEIEPILPSLRGRQRMEALLNLGHSVFWLGDVKRVNELSEELQRLVEQPGSDDLRGPALFLPLLTASMEGRIDDAISHGERAIEMWADGRERELGNLVTLLGISYSWIGKFPEAEKYARQAYEIAQEVKSVDAALTSGTQIALALMGLGRHEEALEITKGVVESWSHLEAQPRLTARALSVSAGVLREMGLFDEARRRNTEAIEAARQAAFQNTISQSTVDLLFTDLATGAIGSVASGIGVAEEEAAKLKGWHEWLVGTRINELRARLALETRPPDEAATVASEAATASARYGRVKYEIGCRLVLAEALSRMKQTKAMVEFQSAVEGAEKLGHPPTLWRAAAAMGSHLYRSGDDSGAEKAYMRAREVVDAFARGLTDDHRAAFLAAPDVSEIMRKAPSGAS